MFGCLGAYALARLRFPGRALIARGLVVTYLVPPSLLFIPLFAVLSTLPLIDTHQGLILTYLGFTRAVLARGCSWATSARCRSSWRRPRWSTAAAGSAASCG